MEFAVMLEALGLRPADAVAHQLLRRVMAADPGADEPANWRNLAVALARRMTPSPDDTPSPLTPWPAARPPLVIGVAGGQGSGKTTLSRLLERAFQSAGARAAAVSLDDFYLTRSERQRLAARVHPLLLTRGVPGTHDLKLLFDVLQALGSRGTVSLPRFDKGLDDRLPPDRWRPVSAPLDVLVIEGWCLGVGPQSTAALEAPCNELEAREDPEGIWRGYVNAALAGPYARLWDRLDDLVFLRVPDMAAVIRWRTLQEQAVEPARRMNDVAIARFVEHYERLTRAALAEVPGRAALVVQLADEHRIAHLALRPGR
jgi:D-glycerate 3-kinase